MFESTHIESATSYIKGQPVINITLWYIQISVGRPQGSRSVITPSPGHHGRNGHGRGWGGRYADRLLIKWSGPVWSLKVVALSYSESGADWQMMHGSLGATHFPVSRCHIIELFTHYQWPYYQVKCEVMYSRIPTSKSSFFPGLICVSICKFATNFSFLKRMRVG